MSNKERLYCHYYPSQEAAAAGMPPLELDIRSAREQLDAQLRDDFKALRWMMELQQRCLKSQDVLVPQNWPEAICHRDAPPYLHAVISRALALAFLHSAQLNGVGHE